MLFVCSKMLHVTFSPYFTSLESVSHWCVCVSVHDEVKLHRNAGIEKEKQLNWLKKKRGRNKMLQNLFTEEKNSIKKKSEMVYLFILCQTEDRP